MDEGVICWSPPWSCSYDGCDGGVMGGGGSSGGSSGGGGGCSE